MRKTYKLKDKYKDKKVKITFNKSTILLHDDPKTRKKLKAAGLFDSFFEEVKKKENDSNKEG